MTVALLVPFVLCLLYVVMTSGEDPKVIREEKLIDWYMEELRKDKK